MKNLILIAFTFFTWTASANTIIAKYDFGSNQNFNGEGKFVKSTLSDSGDLTIEVYTNSLGQDSLARPAADQIIQANISEKNLTLISNMTLSLVSAEIKEVSNAVICMMMPSEFMQSNHLYLNRAYDQNTDEFTGKLALVLGPEGCWVSHKVSLANEWDNQTARKIKVTLEVLVNEHAGHLL